MCRCAIRLRKGMSERWDHLGQTRDRWWVAARQIPTRVLPGGCRPSSNNGQAKQTLGTRDRGKSGMSRPRQSLADRFDQSGAVGDRHGQRRVGPESNHTRHRTAKVHAHPTVAAGAERQPVIDQ